MAAKPRYVITREEALMGGFWYTLHDSKNRKDIRDELGQTLEVPPSLLRQQESLNRQYYAQR